HRRRGAARRPAGQGRRPRVRARLRRPRRRRVTLLAGLDVGTSSVKGLLVAADGEIVARAEAVHGLSTPRPGWAEQDPEDWWAGAPRAGGPRAHGPCAAAEGLRAPAPLRRARDGRRGRLGDAALRRGGAALERARRRGAGGRPGVAAARAGVAGAQRVRSRRR